MNNRAKSSYDPRLIRNKLKTLLNNIYKNRYLIAAIVIGLYLRFFGVERYFIFGAEIGDNLLEIKNAYMSKTIPLLGPPTSHPWLTFPPLYYWLFGPVLILSNFNPFSHAYFAATISLLIIPTNYVFIKRLFTQKIALISSILISISPLYIEFSRVGRFFSITLLAIYPFIYSLYKTNTKKIKYFFWTGFWFGILLNFHYSPFILIPFAVLWILKNKALTSIKPAIYTLLGVLIPLSPLILSDLNNNLATLPKLLAWFPYRLAGFLGLYPKNNFTAEGLAKGLDTTAQYVGSLFIPPMVQVSQVALGVLIISFIIILTLTIPKITSKNTRNKYVFLTMWFWVSVIALLIHGNPPIHYFTPLFIIPILFFSILLIDIGKLKIGKLLIPVIILALLFLNLTFFTKNLWYFQNTTTKVLNPHFIPYTTQLKVAKTIIENSHSNSYQLARVGPDDQFEADFSQNYKYLLWWMGNEPVIKSTSTYTIHEDFTKLELTSEYWVANDIIITLKDENIRSSNN